MADWDPESDETQKQIQQTQLELLKKELARQERIDQEEADTKKRLKETQGKVNEMHSGLAETLRNLINTGRIETVPPPSSNQVFGMCEQAAKGIADSPHLKHANEMIQHEAFGLLFSALERERVEQWAKSNPPAPPPGFAVKCTKCSVIYPSEEYGKHRCGS
jgi:hypothetical protein